MRGVDRNSVLYIGVDWGVSWHLQLPITWYLCSKKWVGRRTCVRIGLVLRSENTAEYTAVGDKEICKDI